MSHAHEVAGASGAVLTGGRSTRMGRDKLFAEVDGRALVGHAIGALGDAGITNIAVIGGPPAMFRAFPVTHVVDRHPGEGPLGAIITALHWSVSEHVMVISGDMAGVDGAAVADLLEAVQAETAAAGIEATVATIDGFDQPLLASYRRTAVLHRWEELFAAGERSPMRALDALRVERVDLSGRGLMDLDEPEDLRRYAALHESD